MPDHNNAFTLPNRANDWSQAMILSKIISCGRYLLGGCFLVAALASGQVQAQEKYRVYFGTYTGKVSKGIYQCEMNLKDGSLSAATLAGETSSPSFIAFHPNKKFLYAVNEGQAAVSAFAIDDQTGSLTFLNSQPSQGAAPCHLVVD